MERISLLLIFHPKILTAYNSQIDPNTSSLFLPSSVWFFLPLGSNSSPLLKFNFAYPNLVLPSFHLCTLFSGYKS